MPIVVMPDGVEVELPDNPTPEQRKDIESLLAAAPQSERPGAVGRTGASALAGYGKAAASIPSLLMAPANAFGGTPISRAVGDMAKSVANFYENIGKKYGLENDYARSAVEAVGGGAAFGGVTPTAVVSSASSGLGSEGAAKLFGDNALTRFLGGLAGGVGGAAAASRLGNVRPQTAAVAKEVLEGIDDGMLKRAQEFQAEAAGRGVQIDLAQALKSVGAPVGNIETLRNFLAQKKHGNQVQAVLQAQPNQLYREANRTVDALPGVNYGERQTANNLQEAATSTINAAKQQRSAAVRQMYADAGDLSPAARKDLSSVVQNFLKQPGLTDDVQAAAKTFLAKLSGRNSDLEGKVTSAREALAAAKTASERAAAQKALAVANAELSSAGAKPLRALDVDTWISELTGPFKGTPLSPVNPKASGQVKMLGTMLNKQFQALSPQVAAAEREFARLSDTLVNPLKQGVTGEFATSRGYKPDVAASMQKFSALLNRGVDTDAKTSDIIRLAKELRAKDPAAFQDAFKSHLSMKLKQVAEPGGVAAAEANNFDIAVKIAKTLWPSEAQAQGLRDAVSVIAKQNGTNPVEAVRGLNKLIQLTDAMKSRPQAIGGLGQRDLFELGSKAYGADALRIFGFLPFERAARRLEDTVLSKTLTQFDEILTSPEGAQLLAKLGKQPTIDRRTFYLLANYGSQAEAAMTPQPGSGQ